MNRFANTKYWKWYFIATAVESLLALMWLLLIPSEAGLSPARLGMAGLLVTFAVCAAIFNIKPPRFTTRVPPYRSILLFLILSLLAGLALFILRYLDPQKLLVIYVRLAPTLFLGLVFGLQSAIIFLIIRNGIAWREFLKQRNIYLGGTFAFFVFVLLVLFVIFTKLGITKDPAYWGEPGTAIIGWQAVLSLLIGFGVLLANVRYAYDSHKFIYDIIIPIAIWIIAIMIWLSVPWSVLQNSFYAPITPPSNVPFPYSDAGAYDLFAQSTLIGEDYQGIIPPRPLYVLFLIGLHLIFNQNYYSIITAQVILLALFPVLLYYLGKKIHSPAAGGVAAFIAIFRELTSLWIASNTRVVNSRILVTDFLSAMTIVLICLILIKWLENRDINHAILAGGSFSLLLLLRTQAVIILPFILTAAWMIMRSNKKSHRIRAENSLKPTRDQHANVSLSHSQPWYVSIGFFIFALLITVTPWLVHNYTITGRFAFDDPNQMGIIYSQYSFTGNLEFSRFDIKTDRLFNYLLDFTIQHPGFVASFISNHFLNTEIGGLLALPLIKRFEGLFEPVNLYWLSWNGSIEWYNFLLILLYLFIIGVGLSAAWARMKLIGLLPLLVNLGYALSNGIARFSSWRYNMPVDWVPFFYFGIGVIEILVGVCILFGVRVDTKTAAKTSSSTLIKATLFPLRSGILLLTFVVIGVMPWVIKYMFLPQYSLSRESLIQELTPVLKDPAQTDTFLAAPNAVIYQGKLLYPRFYRRDLGLSSTNPWPVYAVREFPRIGFVLLNSSNLQVIFPTRESLNFTHGEDVILLGCAQQDYIEARMVYFSELQQNFISAPLDQTCN